MTKIKNYPDLCKFLQGSSQFMDLGKLKMTDESSTRIKKLGKYYPELQHLIDNGKSDRVCLLSSIVGANIDLFSTRNVYTLTTKKEMDKQTRIGEMYKCLRTYCSAFDVVFSYDDHNPQGLYTRVNLLNKKRVAKFLTPDFPLGKLEPIDGVTLGRLQDMVQDMEDHDNYGVDYIFSTVTGKYITPVHVHMNQLALRLKTKKVKSAASKEDIIDMEDFLGLNDKKKASQQMDNDQNNTSKTRCLPQTLFLGSEFDSPVFGFGRCFTLKLMDNVLYSSNNYGINGQFTINALYQNTEDRIKRNYRLKPLNRGVVYDTVRFVENYDQGSSYEEKFFPPSRFVPSIEHFDNTRTSKTLGGKTLREMEMKDIVRIFPPDELTILKLAVGRALIGISGSTEYMNANFQVFSDWRKAVVTVGPPKIGKSTVIEGLADGMEFLGYRVCSGIDFSERFNLGQSLLSDVSVFDDLTQDRLIKNLTSNGFKTTVTNGRMTVEDKGKDKVEVRSITTVIGNANDYTSESLYDVDSGAKNRFVALSAHRAPLGQNPWQMCEKVAMELGIPKVGIWVRILRECLDTALPYCSINAEEPTAGISINSIVDNLSLDNKNYFDSEPGITFIILALVNLGIEQEDVEQYINTLPCDIRDSDLFYLSIEKLYERLSDETKHTTFKNVLQELWSECTERMSIHPHLGLRELRWKSLKHAAKEVQHLVCNSNYEPDNLKEENIEIIISLIKNNNGVIRKSYRGIAKDWKQSLDNPFTRCYIKDRIIEIKNRGIV